MYLQCLRGFASLLVFLNHFNGWVIGYLSVWFFFSLSGYLLIKKVMTKKISFRGYLVNRIYRLLPTYFVVQILTIILLLLFYRDFYIQNPKQIIKEFLTFFMPIHIPNFYNTMSVFNSALWSLQLEFYFLFLIYFLRNKNFFLLILFFSIFLHIFFYFNLEIWPHHYPSFFYNLIFIMGGIFCYFYSKKLKIKITIILPLIIIIIYSSFYLANDNIQIGLKYSPIFFSIIFIFIIKYFSDKDKKKIKNNALIPLYFLGSISYPMYLTHKPILNIFRNFNFFNLGSLEEFFIISFLTIAISYVLHLYVENRYRY
jgi:peptidoglycan/LPS O-acetylase OafA/YrhL